MSSDLSNAGMSALALSQLIRAEEAEDRAAAAEGKLKDLIHTETGSMARIIAKRQLFREAAAEMTEEITTRLSKGLTNDLTDIRVRKGLFSIFKTSVPDDLREDAKAGGQMFLNSLVQRTLSSPYLNDKEIARAGITKTQYKPHFTSGRGSEFLADLDDNEVRSIARLGVVNSLQFAFAAVDHKTAIRNPGETRQGFRATRHAFAHAIERANSVCDEIKAPDERIVIANNPQPVAM